MEKMNSHNRLKVRKEITMNQKENERKQRKLLREFDKELFTYTGQLAWFLSGMFSFICLVLQAIPVQELQNDNTNIWLSICMFIVWISFSVLSPYINMTEAFTPYQRRNKTYDKLKYLPVSRKQYRIVRMGYLFRYIWKLAAAGLAVQCIFAMAIVKYLDIWNIIYVAAIMFVLPLLAGWLMLLEF